MTIENYLDTELNNLENRFKSIYPNHHISFRSYIRYWMQSEDGISVLYFDDALLSSLFDTSFQAEVRSVFLRAKTLE